MHAYNEYFIDCLNCIDWLSLVNTVLLFRHYRYGFIVKLKNMDADQLASSEAS